MFGLNDTNVKPLSECKLISIKVLNQGWIFIFIDTLLLIIFSQLRTGALAQMEGASRLVLLLASFCVVLLLALYQLKKHEKSNLCYEAVLFFTIQLSVLPLFFFQLYNLATTISEEYIVTEMIQYTLIMVVLNLIIATITSTFFYFISRWVDQLHWI